MQAALVSGLLLQNMVHINVWLKANFFYEAGQRYIFPMVIYHQPGATLLLTNRVITG